jgi:hypothetical protein
MWLLLFVSAVTMGVSHTISKERIFEPLRRRLGGRDTWLGYLVSCPFCVSHWIAFVLVPLTGAYFLRVAPRVPVLSPFLDWLLSSLLVAVVAAFLRVAFYFVDETQGLVKRRQRATDLELDELSRGNGHDQPS